MIRKIMRIGWQMAHAITRMMIASFVSPMCNPYLSATKITSIFVGNKVLTFNDTFMSEDLLLTTSAGKVVLVGDAWHPITLNIGQGACCALKDAMVLAKKLAGAVNLD